MGRTTQRKSDSLPTILSTAELDDEPVVPLFPGASDDPERPSRIAITRVVPPDGFLLDTQELNITETWIKDTFGGGAYELTLYNNKGRPMGQPRRIKIAGPQLSRGELEGRAAALKDEQAGADSAMALQTRMFREHIEMLKAEAGAQRDRAKQELELQIRHMQAEADAREDRERARHERDLERERERAERERAREKDALAAQQAQQEKFMLALQTMSKDQTNMMITMIQQSNNKQDPLEAAVRINSMVESRLELQNGDPQERNAQQMWGLVGKGLDAIAGQRPETQAPAPQVQQKPGPRSVPGKPPAVAARNPAAAADLPLPQVVKERLASLMKVMADRNVDIMEVLKGIEEGDLAIVDTEEYLDGQDALKQLHGGQLPDDADETEEPTGAKAPTVDNPRRKNRARADGAAMEPGGEVDGGPQTPATPRGIDADQGDPSPEPQGPYGSGPAVQSTEAQVSSGVS